MSDAVEKFKVDGLEVSIYESEFAESPDNWDNDAAFIVTTDNSYFTSIPEGLHVSAIVNGAIDGVWENSDGRKFNVFPLNAYIHSGVALSLGNEYPFNCPWDSGKIGVVLVSNSDADIPADKRHEVARSIVEIWNQYLSGDVWDYTVERDGETIESCCGIYGFEDCKEQAKLSAHDSIRFEVNEQAKIDVCYAY